MIKVGFQYSNAFNTVAVPPGVVTVSVRFCAPPLLPCAGGVMVTVVDVLETTVPAVPPNVHELAPVRLVPFHTTFWPPPRVSMSE